MHVHEGFEIFHYAHLGRLETLLSLRVLGSLAGLFRLAGLFSLGPLGRLQHTVSRSSQEHALGIHLGGDAHDDCKCNQGDFDDELHSNIRNSERYR